jgi:hypothetical protein
MLIFSLFVDQEFTDLFPSILDQFQEIQSFLIG